MIKTSLSIILRSSLVFDKIDRLKSKFLEAIHQRSVYGSIKLQPNDSVYTDINPTTFLAELGLAQPKIVLTSFAIHSRDQI